MNSTPNQTSNSTPPPALRKLGKKPVKHDRRNLQLSKYLTDLKLPKKRDWLETIKDWPMYANDRIGDCTIASAGHLMHEWMALNGNPFIPGEDQIVKAYSEATGYNPKDGSNDEGAVLLDVLKFWRNNGIAGHKILAFVQVNPRDDRQMRTAIELFGGVYTGFNLPLSCQDQKVWSVPKSGIKGKGEPGSWGGHCVHIGAYSAQRDTCITWGNKQPMTVSFRRVYCDEMYAVLSEDWADRDGAPSGFSLDQLMQDLSQL